MLGEYIPLTDFPGETTKCEACSYFNDYDDINENVDCSYDKR
jgi:hypothetical protein